MSSGSAISSTCFVMEPPSRDRPIAGSARFPTITGWTNSTAMWRTSERAAGEAPSATSRPPRENRSAIPWQQRATSIGLGLEEAPIRLGALGQQGIQPPCRSDGQTAAASRAATPDSHSAKASVPSPVLALHLQNLGPSG